MKKLLVLLIFFSSTAAHAYSIQELRADCQAANDFFMQQKSSDPYDSIKSSRCISYVAGFADGYAIGDYLAEKVGVKLNAVCLPKDDELSARLVRAVLGHIEHLPPKSTGSTAMLVGSALAKSFPCPDSLESK